MSPAMVDALVFLHRNPVLTNEAREQAQPTSTVKFVLKQEPESEHEKVCKCACVWECKCACVWECKCACVWECKCACVWECMCGSASVWMCMCGSASVWMCMCLRFRI
eukprot:scpid86542/ scgid23243/ 